MRGGRGLPIQGNTLTTSNPICVVSPQLRRSFKSSTANSFGVNSKARAIARTQQKSGGPISDYESGPDAGPCLAQQSEKVAAGQGIVSLISNLLLLCNSNFKSEVILNLLELLSSQFPVYLNSTIFF